MGGCAGKNKKKSLKEKGQGEKGSFLIIGYSRLKFFLDNHIESKISEV